MTRLDKGFRSVFHDTWGKWQPSAYPSNGTGTFCGPLRVLHEMETPVTGTAFAAAGARYATAKREEFVDVNSVRDD